MLGNVYWKIYTLNAKGMIVNVPKNCDNQKIQVLQSYTHDKVGNKLVSYLNSSEFFVSFHLIKKVKHFVVILTDIPL